MIIKNIKTRKCSRIILAGDLSGFSFSYDQGNEFIVSEFVKRFYFLVSNIINISKGRLIKFTGDGYLAVWSLGANFEKNSITAKLAFDAANELSRMIKITKLNLNLDPNIHLRQGFTIEPNAIKLMINCEQGVVEDYLGNMINFAFRIQSLAKLNPYICLHKNFIDLLNQKYIKEFEQFEFSKQKLNNLFKGLKVDSKKLFFAKSFPEKIFEMVIANSKKMIEKNEYTKTHERKSRAIRKQFVKDCLGGSPSILGGFDKKLQPFYNSGPKWLKESRFLYWSYYKAMEIQLYDVQKLTSKMKKLTKTQAQFKRPTANKKLKK